MYKLDPVLLERLNERIQTSGHNTDPRPLVYLTRNRTAITSQRYWERTLITSTVGTRSSIAIRRPEGNLLGDMIFTAQVEQGDAIIRYAVSRTNINDMVWTELRVIPNVSELSILFDGFMKKVDGVVEAYTTGELPYVFYVDSNDSLKFINLDDEDIQGTISDNAVNVASVRGLYSETAGLDDGIFCFYTNATGQLWESRILNGEVVELSQVTMKPSGVTAWEDVWASLTFDYRIILQLKGDDGVVYTLVSKSRPSGFSLLEHIRVSKVTVSGKIGDIPPVPLYAENISVSDSWSKRIKIVFDGAVYNVSPILIDYFRLIETTYGSYIYPVNVTYGANNREIYLNFVDFGRSVPPLSLEYLGGTEFGGRDFPMETFTLVPTVKNVWANDVSEFLKVSSATVSGAIIQAFNGELFEDEYIKISSAVVSGDFIVVSFKNTYSHECLRISSASVVGQIIDTGGIDV